MSLGDLGIPGVPGEGQELPGAILSQKGTLSRVNRQVTWDPLIEQLVVERDQSGAALDRLMEHVNANQAK